MQKIFSKLLLSSFFSSLLSVGYWWLLPSFTYENTIGEYVLITNFIGILISICEIGLGITIINYITKGLDVTNIAISAILWNTLIVVIISSISIKLWLSDSSILMSSLIILAALLQSVLYLIGSVMFGSKLILKMMAIDIINQLLRIGLLCTINFKPSLENLFIINIISMIIAISLGLIMMKPALKFRQIRILPLSFFLRSSYGIWVSRLMVEAHVFLVPILVGTKFGALSLANFQYSWIFYLAFRTFSSVFGNTILVSITEKSEFKFTRKHGLMIVIIIFSVMIFYLNFAFFDHYLFSYLGSIQVQRELTSLMMFCGILFIFPYTLISILRKNFEFKQLTLLSFARLALLLICFTVSESLLSFCVMLLLSEFLISVYSITKLKRAHL